MYANELLGRRAPGCTGTRPFQKNIRTQQSSLVGLVKDATANAKRTPSKVHKTQFFQKTETIAMSISALTFYEECIAHHTKNKTKKELLSLACF